MFKILHEGSQKVFEVSKSLRNVIIFKYLNLMKAIEHKFKYVQPTIYMKP